MNIEEGISLGDFLRQERERRGITIEQVASATKINIRILHALEENHYAELPAKPFIRGFVTSYVRFLGLDPQEILTHFDVYLEEKSKDRPTRDAGHSGYVFERRESDQSRTMLWLVLGAFAIVGGLVFVFLKPSFKHRSRSHVETLKGANHSPTPIPATSTSPVPAFIGPLPEAKPSELPSKQPSVEVISPSPSPSPSSVAQPKPSPSVAVKPSPTAQPEQKPEPKPSPRPSPTPKVSAQPNTNDRPSPSGKPRRPDLLNKGEDLEVSEVKQKVVVKALDDLYVRYKVDEKPKNKLILRKGRILVLKAEKVIRFQVSKGDGATVNWNSGGDKPINLVTGVATQQESPTVVFPRDLSESEKNAFSGDSTLHAPPPPPLRPESQEPAATP